MRTKMPITEAFSEASAECDVSQFNEGRLETVFACQTCDSGIIMTLMSQVPKWSISEWSM